MSHSQYFPGPQRQYTDGSATSASATASGGANDELHMPGISPISDHQHHVMSPRDQYPPSAAMNRQGSGNDYASSSSAVARASSWHHNQQSYPNSGGAVPNVLQPAGASGGGAGGTGGTGGSSATAPPRPPPLVSANTAPTLPTIQAPQPPQPQSHDYSSYHRSAAAQTPNTSNIGTLNTSSSMAHSYSRSSPGGAGAYDPASSTGGSASYHSYTPTTPGGGPSSAGSGQFMSPTDLKYSAPGSQRNISNTPLGLADIRPRADSTMSDTNAAAMGYNDAHAQPGTSNYLAPWAIYAFDWCKWQPQGNSAGKLAVGSYLEDGHNFIQILDSHMVPTPQDVYKPGTSKYSLEFNKVAEATHSYPVTRLLWEPPSSQKQSTDLLATSGDHLRLWSLPSETPATPGGSITNRSRDQQPTTKLTPLALLSNSKTPDHTAPLTSLDWNTVSPSLIITSSIDTTCTIWDIPSLTAKTQLIAHDKEVYDVRFCANSVDVFVSCGQDGSVRMFDLRSLEHSTIIYEPTGKDDKDPSVRAQSPTTAQQTMSNPPPLLRLATSPHDTHLLATFAQDSGVIRILDVRQPGQALLELRGHSGPINCLEWSPNRRGMLASGGDDCQVLLWDLLNSASSSSSNPPPLNGGQQVPGQAGQQGGDSGKSPVASWECQYEIGNLGWVPHLQGAGDGGEWLGVSAGRGIWGTRVS